MAIVMMAMSPMKMWADDVASVTINGITTNYTTVEAAFTAANVVGKSTVKLLADCSNAQNNQYFLQATTGNITLDLNGKTITSNGNQSAIRVTNGATMTIDDTNPNITGSIVSSIWGIDVNGGNLTIKKGRISTTDGDYARFAILFTTGKLTIEGGEFYGKEMSLYAYDATDYSAGDIVLSGGKFIVGEQYSIEVPYEDVPRWDIIDFQGKMVDENDNEVFAPTNAPVMFQTFTVKSRIIDVDTYTLVDGADYNDSWINATTFTYKRTFSNTNWQALYVPFQMSYSDWNADFDVATIQNFHEYTDENGVVQNTVLEVRYVKSGKLKANHPYLIRPKTAGEKTITLSNVALANPKSNSIVCQSVERKYTFTGTYNSMQDLYTNDYLFMTGGSLMKAMDDDTTLKAQRWYLAIENLDAQVESGSSPAGAKAINISVIGEDDATGIEEIKVISTSVSGTSATAAGIYDLQGRRQQSLGKGVNIIRQTDGTVKKVMVK